MKKALFVLMFVFVALSVNSQTIGFVRNAQYRISISMDPIKAKWEKLLLEQKNPTILTDFIIKSGEDKITGKTYYLLVGTNRTKSVKIAELLKLKANGDFIFMPKEELSVGIVTCSGCQVGCGPEILDNQWVCEPDCLATSEKPCEKTLSIP